MKLFLISLLCLLLSPLHAESPGPLLIQPDSAWSMDFKEENSLTLYSIYKKKSEHPSLTLTILTQEASKERIQHYLTAMISQLKVKTEDGPTFSLDSLKGGSISGEIVTFRLPSGLIDTHAIFSDDRIIWRTDYHGSIEEWKEALGFIQKIKRK